MTGEAAGCGEKKVGQEPGHRIYFFHSFNKDLLKYTIRHYTGF